MKRIAILFILCGSMSFLQADIQSTTGNVNMDANSDGNPEVVISDSGMGIGTSSASANLHVLGNSAFMGDLGVSMSASSNASLQISGSMGFSVETHSSNATLGVNSYVFVDSSSDNLVMTLPYAGNMEGRSYMIKKLTNSNNVQINGGGSLIDNVGTMTLESSANSVPFLGVISSANQWFISSMSGDGVTPGISGLVGWWKLDETSGNVAVDSSGLGNHGYLSDNYDFSGNSVSGNLNTGLELDGTDEHIHVNNSDSLDVDDYTLSVWLYPHSVSSFKPLFIRGDASADDIEVYLASLAQGLQLGHGRDNGGTNEAAANNNSTNTSGSGGWGTLTANKWVFFTVTKGNNEWKVYYDAVQQGSTVSQVDTLIDTDKPWRFGFAEHSVFGVNDEYDGIMDDIRIYNRALTGAEILLLYQEGD